LLSILVSFYSTFAASIAFQHFVGTTSSIIKCNPIANASPSKPPAVDHVIVPGTAIPFAEAASKCRSAKSSPLVTILMRSSE
jgi:hypothetical protein